MPFIGNQPALSYTSFAKQDFTTSATTTYTLDNPVANANELALFINFVRQEPTTSYSASGTTLTLTEATSSSDDMYCVFLGKAVQTVNPPNASVGTSQLASSLDLSSKTVTLASNMTNTPSFKAIATSNTQVNNVTYTTITLNGTPLWDTDNAFDNTTDYDFTVPTGKGGKYMFSYGVALSNLGDADFSEIILAVNGTRDERTRSRFLTGSAQTTIMRASAILDLSAGDTVVLQAYHNFGSYRNTSLNQVSFEGMRLIGA